MAQAGVTRAGDLSTALGREASERTAQFGMKRFLLALLLLIIVIGIGGATYLAFYPIPAPTKHMEVPVPNDKLSH